MTAAVEHRPHDDRSERPRAPQKGVLEGMRHAAERVTARVEGKGGPPSEEHP